ncbi:MAG TPA: PEPxxWA-CTERM sorting domain-containing protein [Phenylobacterium sp.]|nr:PEPxxWA-CTERM sorting domain-containing protein [Phenylobacterium sp.]
MKFLGLIIAGALAVISQSAAASVIFLPADTSKALLQGWGDVRAMDEQVQPFTDGPVTFGDGVTFSSTHEGSVIGYVGGYGFGQNPYWAAGGDPMAGLNTAEGAMTFEFATPVASVLAEINWATGYSDGQPIFISIFDSSDQLLETFQLSDGDVDLLETGYYGFSRGTADIRRLVMSNGYIGARNFYTNYGSGGGGGGFGPQVIGGESLQAAVPEPATWLMMIVGFGASGAMLRRARRPVPAVVRA